VDSTNTPRPALAHVSPGWHPASVIRTAPHCAENPTHQSQAGRPTRHGCLMHQGLEQDVVQNPGSTKAATTSTRTQDQTSEFGTQGSLEVPTEELHGKIVIDTMKLLPTARRQHRELDDESTTSSALLQAHLPDSKVVKGFNTSSSAPRATGFAAPAPRTVAPSPSRATTTRRRGRQRTPRTRLATTTVISAPFRRGGALSLTQRLTASCMP